MMSTELHYLALTALLTALIWMTYGTARLLQYGLNVAVGNREVEPQLSPWAERCRRAHRNAVENLAVFAPLVLVLAAAGISNGATRWACILYFWMRVLHLLTYGAGIIWVRTLVWSVAWICIAVLAWQALM
jgi:uncharacterized MAPEG superfamily protein